MRIVAALTLILLATSPVDAKERYFAVRPLDSSQQLDDFRITWYSKHLTAMDEPSLWLGDHKTETYRVLWLRTFHAPFVFRVTVRPDGTSELTTKKTDGLGGYDPGNIVTNKTTQIDRKETGTLVETLERTKFWNLPTNESALGGTDGAQWIIEGVKDGKYHIVDRWGGGEINDWALLLMSKSGEDLHPIY